MKVLELRTFQFRNKKQKCKPDFFLLSVFAKSVWMLSEQNCKIFNQMLHYSNEFNQLEHCGVVVRALDL